MLLHRILGRLRGTRHIGHRQGEPSATLAALHERGTLLHVQPLDAPPRHGRKEPDLQVAWWWHRGDHTVVLGRDVVVSVLGPNAVERAPLRFVDAAQIVTVGLGGPVPGEVERARGTSLALDPHPATGDPRPLPSPSTPRQLAPLVGRLVELQVDGGATVEHRGALVRPGTEELPSPRGRLEAAIAGQGHLLLVLDDLTVAVVHAPCELAAEADGAVRLAGDLGRVVLDVALDVTAAAPAVHVARDAVLRIRPLPAADPSPGGPGPDLR